MAALANVGDMLVTVKVREVPRARLDEMSGDREAARRHFLAAAHLELVLAADYERAGEATLAHRSRVRGASCLWRGGQATQAQTMFTGLLQTAPDQESGIRAVVDDLSRHYPAQN